MNRLTLVPALAVTAALVGAAVPTLVATDTAPASQSAETTFSVDPVHSMVFFSIGHLGVANNYGRFNNPEGAFNIDFENPGASFVDVSVKAENVDTGNSKRDDHLRSPDFFNAKQFPVIAFKGSDAEAIDDDTMRISGELTMHGQTRPLTVEIEKIGEGETRQGYKMGVETKFTINRSDFGMTKYLAGDAIGDAVTLMVALEGARQ